MKKIISALTLTALALGAASADVKFALNYRTQMVGFSRLVAAPDTNSDENHNNWFQQSKGWQSASDTVSVSASTDYAGATIRIDPSLDKDGTTSLTLQQYNAWVRLGNLEIGNGVWKDGLHLKEYLLANDSDAGWYQGDLWQTVKLGNLFGTSITTAMTDMVNFAGAQGGLTGYATYKLNTDGAKFAVTGALIGYEDAEVNWDDDASIYTGFGLRVNAELSGFSTQFVFKSASDTENAGSGTSSRGGEQRGIGLYVKPDLDALELVVGGAAGFKNGELTEANIDVRARKELEESGTSITFYTNVSHITNDNDYSADIKHLGAEYLSGGAATTVAPAYTGVHGTQKYATAMWNFIGVRQKIQKGLYFLFSAGDNVSLDNVGKDEWRGLEAYVAPGVQIMNGKSGIAAYCRVGMSNIGVKDYNKGDSENELAVMIPVVVRVRF